MAKELKVGDLVFVPHPDDAYNQGVLSSIGDGGQVTVKLVEDKKDVQVALKDLVVSPPECNLDDMTMIRGVNHESAMVECLKLRYMQQDQMYTYVGTGVLIAVNPFQPLPMNRPQEVPMFRGKDPTEMPPHVYILADQAYKAVSQEFVNQAFIVSGESGAGKTESCKLVMSFLSLANAKFLPNGQIVKSAGGEAALAEKLMDQIMASNPVLEAFGNAKSVRNNNSSRFGKFLLMDYNNGVLKGARMKNYLLEKSRVVQQGPEERNYHAFYQLLCGATPAQHKELMLNNIPPKDWGYLSMSGCTTIPGVDDKAEFNDMAQSLTDIGVNDDEKHAIFLTLAVILHLGQVQFAESGDGSTPTLEPLQKIATLLQISVEDFTHALCFRHMFVGGEEFVKPNPKGLALDSRDTIARTLYSKTFDWLFDKLNDVLKPTSKSDGTPSFFGILDIFGFEIFKKNSFEQLCINFTNEKLQQIFILRVFLGEQQEYTSEGLKWDPVDYSDNKPCCDLIEAPKTGVLAMLDEEGTVPKGSDQTWVDKLHGKHGSNPYYTKPRIAKTEFIINHYAGPVTYECAGFMDKNKDFVHPDLIKLLSSSKIPFIQHLFREEMDFVLAEEASRTGGGSGKKTAPKATAGRTFLKDLNDLGGILVETPAWYVRCIKPNQAKKPRMWGGMEVCRQLRYNNVLETIRVRQLGFLYRRPFMFFIKRFWLCADGPPMSFHPTRVGTDERGFCQRMVDAMDFPPGFNRALIACGRTKIFVKSAVELDEIERIRKRRLAVKCIVIQAKYKGHFYTKRLAAWKKSSYFLQARMRMMLNRRPYVAAVRAAQYLQKSIRRYLPRLYYVAMIHTASLLLGSKATAPIRDDWAARRASAETLKKSFTRAKFVGQRKGIQRLQAVFRRNFTQNSNAAIILQSAYRRAVRRRDFDPKRRGAMRINANIRRLLARRKFGIHRVSATHIKRIVLKRLLSARFQRSFAAADKMRSAVRMCLSREKLCMERLSAIDLEAVAVRMIYRRFLKIARAHVQRLQTVLRRALNRRRYGSMRVAILKLQPIARRKKDQRQMGMAALSAIRLETRVRRTLVRRRLAAQRLAAVKLQSYARVGSYRIMHGVGRVVSIELEYVIRRIKFRQGFVVGRTAILALQAAVRQTLQRQEIRRERLGAFKLQAIARRAITHMVFRTVGKKVKNIQSAILRCLAQRYFRKSKRASTGIKSRLRFILNRNRFATLSLATKEAQLLLMRSHAVRVLKRARGAVSFLQTVVRRTMARYTFQKVRNFTVALQAQMRRGVWMKLLRTCRASTKVVSSKAKARIVRFSWKYFRHAVTVLQSQVRRAVERRTLQLFRRDIKDVTSRMKTALVRTYYSQIYAARSFISARMRMLKPHSEYLNVARALTVLTEMQRFGAKRNAAVVLQAAYRRGMVRWWFIVGHFTSVLLQSYVRRALVNHRLVWTKIAVAIVSNHIKMALQRGKISYYRHNALTLQKHARAAVKFGRYNWGVAAAIRIQAHLRTSLYRSMFVIGRNACRTIQTSLARLLIRGFYSYVRCSAIELQAACRRAIFNKLYTGVAGQPLILQSAVRRTLAQIDLYWTYYAASVAISACQRSLYSFGFGRARASARTIQSAIRRSFIRLLEYFVPRLSAVQLQAAALRTISRRRLFKWSYNAKVLQSAVRRALWQRIVGVLKHAGKIITKSSRRTLWRGTYCTARVAAIILQASALRGPKNGLFPRRRRAAFILQKVARRCLGNLNRNEALFASARLSSIARRYIAMNRMRRHVVAALVLISFLETHISRNRIYATAYRAVVKSQTAIRRMLARGGYAKARTAIVAVEAAARRSVLRRRYCFFQRQRVAAEKLKSVCRRVNTREIICQLILSTQFLQAAILRTWDHFGYQIARRAAVVIESLARRRPRQLRIWNLRNAAVAVEARLRRRNLESFLHPVRLATFILQAKFRRAVARRMFAKFRVPAMIIQARLKRTYCRRTYLLKKRISAVVLQAILRRAVLQRLFRRKITAGLRLNTAVVRLVVRRKLGVAKLSSKLIQAKIRRMISRRKFSSILTIRHRLIATVKKINYRRRLAAAQILASALRRSIKRSKHAGRLRIYSALRWVLRRQMHRRPFENIIRAVRVSGRFMKVGVPLSKFKLLRKAIREIQAIVRRRKPRYFFIGKPNAAFQLTRFARRGIRLRNLPQITDATAARDRYNKIKAAAITLSNRTRLAPIRHRFLKAKYLARSVAALRRLSQQRKLYVKARASMAGFLEWREDEEMCERWVTLKNGILSVFVKLGDTQAKQVVPLQANFQVESSSDNNTHQILITTNSSFFEMNFETAASRLAWFQALLYAQHMRWFENKLILRAWLSGKETNNVHENRLREIARCALALYRLGNGVAPTSTGLARSILLPKSAISSSRSRAIESLNSNNFSNDLFTSRLPPSAATLRAPLSSALSASAFVTPARFPSGPPSYPSSSRGPTAASSSLNISPELNALLSRLRAGETAVANTYMPVAPTHVTTTPRNPFSPPHPSRPLSPLSTSHSLSPARHEAPSLFSAGASAKRILILASPSRSSELVDWVQGTLIHAGNKNQISSINIIGREMGSLVGRTIRPVSTLLAARVNIAGETIDDTLRILLKGQPGGEDSIDLFLLMWDASGHGSSEFARLLSTAGRSRIVTALNVNTANKVVNEW